MISFQKYTYIVFLVQKLVISSKAKITPPIGAPNAALKQIMNKR